jgi:hypothetical protein
MDVTEQAAESFEAASGRVEEPRVESVVDAEDSATVTVSYAIADERLDAVMELARVDGRWIPLPGTATGEVRATATIGGFVAIGDVVLPADAPIRLLPAVYALAPAPTAMLDGAATVRVLPGDTADVELTATLRPEATDIAQEQLDAHLAECTAPAATVPPGCGIRIPWAADLTAVSGIRYRIEQSPALTLSATSFRADSGVLVATVTGSGFDGAERTVSYRTQSWALIGDVAFTAEDIVLTAW